MKSTNIKGRLGLNQKEDLHIVYTWHRNLVILLSYIGYWIIQYQINHGFCLSPAFFVVLLMLGMF